MNRLENWFCATKFWRGVTANRLLPWMLDGCDLGDRVLEIGAGAGAATRALRQKCSSVTSLEYSSAFAAKLAKDARRGTSPPANVVQGDAAALPFATESFTSAVAILVLHHLRSRELQDCAFAEVHRVLKPGGTFLALEIPDGWFTRQLHIGSTFVAVSPGGGHARLYAAGFPRVAVTFRHGAFLLRAIRANS